FLVGLARQAFGLSSHRGRHKRVLNRFALVVNHLATQPGVPARLRHRWGSQPHGRNECNRRADGEGYAKCLHDLSLTPALGARSEKPMRTAPVFNQTPTLECSASGRYATTGGRRKDYLAKRSKMSTSSASRRVFSGSPRTMPSGTHRS